MTKALFYELSYDKPVHVLFTLKDDDIEVGNRHLHSLKKLYLSIVAEDPTEYTFAQSVFGNWDIWDTIRKSPLVKPYIDGWRRETEVKIKSSAIQSIIEESRSGRNAYQASKLLLERGWIERETATATKEKARREQERKLDDEAYEKLKEDAERLGLTLEDNGEEE